MLRQAERNTTRDCSTSDLKQWIQPLGVLQRIFEFWEKVIPLYRENRSQMNRRSFLAGTAMLMASPLTGCLDRDREGVIFTHAEIKNASGVPRDFELLITHDDEIIHWSSHLVGFGEYNPEIGSIISIDSPDERGHVEVFGRTGDFRERLDFDNTNRWDGEYVNAVVEYRVYEDDPFRISGRLSAIAT